MVNMLSKMINESNLNLWFGNLSEIKEALQISLLIFLMLQHLRQDGFRIQM